MFQESLEEPKEIVNYTANWNEKKKGSFLCQAPEGYLITHWNFIEHENRERSDYHVVEFVPPDAVFESETRIRDMFSRYLKIAGDNGKTTVLAELQQEMNRYLEGFHKLRSSHSALRVEWEVQGSRNPLDQRSGKLRLSIQLTVIPKPTGNSIEDKIREACIKIIDGTGEVARFPNATEYVLHTATPLERSGSNFQFLLADNNDLFAIKKSGTGTNTTEVHVLSAASNYQTFTLHTGTCLHETDNAFEFLLARNNDLYAIKKSGSASTEVHVLSAAKAYKEFSLQTGTGLHPTDGSFQFLLADNNDLYAIKKSNTGSNTTEVHVLSAASNYQTFTVHTGTCLHTTDGRFEFLLARNNDVYAVKKSATGSGTTEVHALSAAKSYKEYSFQTGTVLHETDDNFQFMLSRNGNVYFVSKQGGSGSTEVHAFRLLSA